MQPHRADGNDAGAVAGDDSGQFHRVSRGGVGADEHRVGAAVGGKGLSGLHSLVAEAGLNSELRRQRDPRG
ncbi:MAG: hypothetical protein Q8N45_10325, partial [Anaerolineales bacterium]|nr:hypothetical protein [Anaerolineales bacterium]